MPAFYRHLRCIITSLCLSLSLSVYIKTDINPGIGWSFFYGDHVYLPNMCTCAFLRCYAWISGRRWGPCGLEGVREVQRRAECVWYSRRWQALSGGNHPSTTGWPIDTLTSISLFLQIKICFCKIVISTDKNTKIVSTEIHMSHKYGKRPL